MNKAPLYELSKSRILYGMQCDKRLYWHVHDRASEPAPDPATAALLEEGRTVEVAARQWFTHGFSLEKTSSEAALTLTQEAIARGEKTLFQAAFLHNGVFVRTDILDRLPDGRWRLIEIKAGTRVRRKHLPDVAIQYWVTRGTGLSIARCEIMHLNKDCVYPSLDDLFLFQDVTPYLDENLKKLPEIMKRFRHVLEAGTAPARDIGRHCRNPALCTFEERCRKPANIPAISIFNIPKLETSVKWEFYQKGQVELTMSTALALSPLQRRMVDCTLGGKRFVNNNAIGRAIVGWKTPFYYLDFETISPAIPLYPGLHPGNSFPFQFSVRTQDQETTVEKAYLHESRTDPRPLLTAGLLESIGPTGSIVTYNRATEKGALLTLATCASKADAARLREMAARLVDALPIMRAHVYDPAFGGSFSLKDVAPALFGDDFAYGKLAVSDGQAAQRAYMELTDEQTPPEKKSALRRHLLFYCGQDTQALARLTAWLFLQAV